jgi:transposase
MLEASSLCATTTPTPACGSSAASTRPPNVDTHCYEPMDRLLQRQKAIQKNLTRCHLKGGHLVLYDITSVYFEGDYKDSELVRFGYNRDGKKGHEQIVVGLICTGQGCPVGVEVYAGNTKDETTVIDKVHEIKDNYGIEKVVFVGDRGMLTHSNIEALKDEKDLQTISALTHGEMKTLLDKQVIALDLFDERSIYEVTDPVEPRRRYCLCRNPQAAQREHEMRGRLLRLTTDALAKIAAYKRAATVETLGARVGRVLAKYKMGKFIQWSVEPDPNRAKSSEHRLHWSIKTDKMAEEQRFDGCYIIASDVDQQAMNTLEVVNAYKRLTFVERAFRSLKTVQLEIRPVYHKTRMNGFAAMFFSACCHITCNGIWNSAWHHCSQQMRRVRRGVGPSEV